MSMGQDTLGEDKLFMPALTPDSTQVLEGGSGHPSESLLRRRRTMGLGKLTQDLASIKRGKAKIMAKSPRLSCANKQKGPFLLDPLLAVFGHTHEHAHVCECVCTHRNPFASPKRNNHERSTRFVFVGCNAFSPESHLTSR